MSSRLEEPSATAGRASPEAAKRRQILEGARRVFLDSGFDGASMGGIARAAGVSKGTLYVYFESKEDLFEALATEEKSDLAEALFHLDENDPDVRAALTKLGTSLVRMMIRPDHIASVRMVIGAAHRMPRFGQAFYEAGPQRGVERLAAYLERQVAAGRLRIEDPALAAEQFLNLCSAGILKRLLFAVDRTVEEPRLARNVRAAVDLFMEAFGQPGSGKSPQGT